MKPYVIPAALVFGLISCTYNDVAPIAADALPVREVSYNLDGTVSWIKTFTYDDQRRKIREYREPVNISSTEKTDINYQFDSEGHLIKRTEAIDGVIYFVAEYVYENNLLKSEATNYPNSTGDSRRRTEYFYSGNLVDSVVGFAAGMEPKGVAHPYEYDDQERLINDGAQTFTYDESDRVISACNIYYNECYETEYNSAGQISKYYLAYNFDEPKRYLMDEYIYVNGRLEEKRSYNYFYLLGPAPGPDIFIKKYEY